VSTAYALANSFTFAPCGKRCLRLSPRGQLRLVVADARGPAAQRFSHTLFFSSLLAAPFYHELIMAHCCLPSAGHHGPFNVAELTPAMYVPIDAAALRRRVAGHLQYRRFGCAPIAAERRRSVTALVDDLLKQSFDVYALAPCEWFSAPTNGTYPHEWSHALLEYHEYVLFDTLHDRLVCLMFAFD
jgi:hypothetical protein